MKNGELYVGNYHDEEINTRIFIANSCFAKDLDFEKFKTSSEMMRWEIAAFYAHGLSDEVNTLEDIFGEDFATRFNNKITSLFGKELIEEISGKITNLDNKKAILYDKLREVSEIVKNPSKYSMDELIYLDISLET